MGSVEPARLVGGDHVLDVDEGVLSTVHLKGLEGLLDEVTDVLTLLLAVVNSITRVPCTRGGERGRARVGMGGKERGQEGGKAREEVTL